MDATLKEDLLNKLKEDIAEFQDIIYREPIANLRAGYLDTMETCAYLRDKIENDMTNFDEDEQDVLNTYLELIREDEESLVPRSVLDVEHV